jgi:RNA polymerase sigma-70 factor (sigma-E family)
VRTWCRRRWFGLNLLVASRGLVDGGSILDDFEAFFARNYSSVRRALTLAFGSADLADDAAQEAFICACVRWSRVRSMARPQGWVYVTATNVARDHLRRTGRREYAEGRENVDEAVRDVATSAVAHVDVRDALAALAPRQRMAVVLRYLADLTNEEVARAMGCSVGTVKSTLHSALAGLRVELEETR